MNEIKVQLLHSCLDCGQHEWIRGKPRCKHPNLKLSAPGPYDDGLLFPACPTDSRKFRKDCPLTNYDESIIKQIL